MTDKSKVGRMSRRKGQRFERDVCKALTKWWKSEFHRTPMSGGSALKKGFNLAGDVVTADKSFPFHIECKNQEGWELDHLLTLPTFGKLGEWYAQAYTEARKGSIPLLIFTRNNRPVFFLFQWSNVEFEKRHSGLSQFALEVLSSCNVSMTLNTPYGQHSSSEIKGSTTKFVVGLLNDLTSNVSKEAICKALNTSVKIAATASKPKKLRCLSKSSTPVSKRKSITL